jgi:hypothetical protein
MKKSKSKTLLWVIIVSVSLLVLASASAVAYTVYNSNSSSVSFQLYEPSELPDRMKVTGRTIEAFKSAGGLFYTKSLRFEFDNPKFTLSEHKNNYGLAYNCEGLEVTDFSTCSIEKTMGGQQFQLLTTLNPDTKEPWSQGVAWLKGDTILRAEIGGTKITPYPLETWIEFIDSFEPKEYQNLPVKHFPSSP